jgi:hypothetical protein
MASRDKGGERMRSNRLAKDAEFEDTLPPEVDKFVRSLRFDGRNGMPRAIHPSGVTLIDDVLMIGFHSRCDEVDQSGASASSFDDFEVGQEFDAQGEDPIVLNGFYTQLQVCEIVRADRTDPDGLLLIDVSNPRAPLILRALTGFGGEGAPGVIRRADGRYLIGELSGIGDKVTWYKTNTDDLRTTTSLIYQGKWEWFRHLGCAEEGAALGTEDCKGGPDTIWIDGEEYPWTDDAQGFSLVRDQKTNALYAFLFDNSSDLLSDGNDIAVMLRVNEEAIDRGNWADVMTYLGSKHFEASDAGQGLFSPGIAPMGDFEAATSLYVSPTGQMILYAAMHDGSTLDGKKIVEMGEFRSRTVMAPTTSYRGPYLFQCGVDLPVTVSSVSPPSIETRIPCAGQGPSCVISLGLVLPEAVYPFTYTVDGEECRSCQDVSDCVQNYYEAQCGTVFNYDYLPWAQQQFGPGPVYPVTEIGRFEVRAFALPPYALVEPWVMLHDEYDGRTLFTSDDPPMSLMMDWADRSDDDFGDLTEFDNPGAGSFNDETSDVTYCATPGTKIWLREDSGGGCEYNVLVVEDDDADGVAHFESLPEDVDDKASCVRLLGSLGKDPTIRWSLDGVPLVLSTVGPEVAIDGAELGLGTHTLTARIWNRTAGATIVVVASNLAPTFTAAAPPAVNEDAGATAVAGWAVFDPTAAGEPDEAGQTVVGYQVTAVSNPGLFASGPAVATDGTLTYTPAANAFGTSTFDVTVQDSGGTASGGVDTSASKSFTITVRSVNDAPSFTAASLAAVDEDAVAQEVAFATFSAGPANEGEQAVAAYMVTDVSVPALFARGPVIDTTGLLTFKPAANANGTSTFKVQVLDDGGTLRNGVNLSPEREFTITVNAVNDEPTVLAVSPATQTVQYSDGVAAVTFSASDIDSPSLTMMPDAPPLPEGLSLGGPICTPVTVPLIGMGSTCTWALTGRAGASAGTYDLGFTVSDGGLSAATGTQIVVEPEDAQVTIDQANEVALQVAAEGGSSGAFTLAFTLHEVDDPDDVTGDANLAGDITRGETTMTLVPVGPGSPVAGTCVEVGTTLLEADPDSPHDYEALRVECSFAAVPVNTYSVEVAVVGFAPLAAPSALTVGSAPTGQVIYYSAASTVTVTDVLTIFDPSLGFTTGGGWVRWPGTADEATGYAGDKTSFGYTMKYNKRKTNLQGSLLVVRHLPDGRVVRLKSNALEGLSLGRVAGEFGWAAFSGKGTYQAIDWPEALGNYRFTTYVEDHTASGGADRFWIEVTDGTAVVQPDLSLPKPAPARAEALQGGSIHVP